MLTLHTIDEVRAQVRAWKAAGLRVACVPTMGNLHAGHLRLVSVARQHADKVVASVFVNPTQFGPNEDFDSYPRTLETDREKLATAGTHLLFAPPVEEMYPGPSLTWVDVEQLGDHLCGASRPGHFRGVSTVVSKLFHIMEPDVACFGEKDYQQLAIIRRMVKDLCFAVEVVGVPTERESDGLAMSSRNGYLTPAQRAVAPQVHAHLLQARDALTSGETDFDGLVARLSGSLETHGFQVDYLQIMDAAQLVPATLESREIRVAVAARLGKTRLIDNIAVAIVRD